MPSIITHAIIPISLRIVVGKKYIPGMLLFYACVASILPDIDVIAFKLGIPYEHQFGHRGLTHSIAFSVFGGIFAMLIHGYLQCKKTVAFFVIFISMVSHPILDALTNGGLGVALFWPFSDERIFFPWQPIEVSPIGLKSFLSARGFSVIRSELVTIWLPCLLIAAVFAVIRASLARLPAARISRTE